VQLRAVRVSADRDTGEPRNGYQTHRAALPFLRSGATHPLMRGPLPMASGQLNLTFIEVPFSSSTRTLTPAAGSFTPCSGSSAYQYFLVSSNNGLAA
jgi:hypothetical protein